MAHQRVSRLLYLRSIIALLAALGSLLAPAHVSAHATSPPVLDKRIVQSEIPVDAGQSTLEAAVTTGGMAQNLLAAGPSADVAAVTSPPGLLHAGDGPEVATKDCGSWVEEVPLSVLGPLADPNPGLSLSKVASGSPMHVGETVVYTYTIANIGDTVLDPVELGDDRVGTIVSAGAGISLTVGQTTTLTRSYVVQMSDFPGPIVNTAVATGTPPGGGVVTTEDTATVDVYNPAAGVVITKDPDLQVLRVGEAASFTITVTNTGTVDLAGVSVIDAPAPDCMRTVGTLTTGAFTSYTCSRANVTEDFQNVAAVLGTPPSGPGLRITDTARVDVIQPLVLVSKSADVQYLRNSGQVSFTIIVTNMGDVRLDDIVVGDTMVPGCGRTIGTLWMGHDSSHVCGPVSISTDFTNTVIVTATPPVGGVVTNTDSATVDVLSPSLTIDKTPDLQYVRSGDTVTFTVWVTNTGDSDLSNVTVDDALAPDCDNTIGPLYTGDHATYTCTADNITADFTNTVIVTGTPPDAIEVSDTDTAEVQVIAPAISVDKTPDLQYVRSGGTVTFTVRVTNTGDIALADVTVMDVQVIGCGNVVGPLAVAGHTSYTCTADNITADFINSATAIGTPPDSIAVSDTDTAEVQVITPAISIDKTPDLQYVRSGDTVTFTVWVTNTGDSDLSNVTVDDALAPDCDNTIGPLYTGDHATYTCTADNITADFTNTVIVTGTPPDTVPVTDTHNAVVDVINPAIVIDKLPDTQMVRSGEAITFTIVLTNSGDVELAGVTISDPLAVDCERTIGILAPGHLIAYTCTLGSVTADFTNTATASGIPPDTVDVSDTDTAYVAAIGPAVRIEKLPDLQTIVSGNAVTFTIVVTNTGDVPLEAVAVSDAQAQSCSRTLGPLAPGYHTGYTCAQTNVTAGFTNTATVSAVAPAGDNVTDSDTARVDVRAPSPTEERTYLPLIRRN